MISTLILDWRFVKFILVGVLNTIFGYSVYAFLLFLGAHFALASLCSTVLGVLFNFNTTGRLVFGNREKRRIFRFVLVYAFLYVLNVGMLKLLNLMGINYYIAGAMTVPVVAISGYLIMRSFVFGSES